VQKCGLWGCTRLLGVGGRARVQAGLWETMYATYQLLLPVWERRRAYDALATAHVELAACVRELAATAGGTGTVGAGKPRFLASHYAVRYIGTRFGPLRGRMFVFRERRLTRLAEVTARLQGRYAARWGPEAVEVLPGAGAVDPATLDPSKVRGSARGRQPGDLAADHKPARAGPGGVRIGVPADHVCDAVLYRGRAGGAADRV
jgi:hypothetical protein